MLLDHVAHVPELDAGLHIIDGLLQALPSVYHQLLDVLLWRADEKGLIEVAVVATVVHSHVHIDNITVLVEDRLLVATR